MESQKIIEELRAEIINDEAIPFIGAGLSMEAKMGDGRFPPSDKFLLDQLISATDGLSKGEVDMLLQKPRSEQTRFLRAHFKDELGVHIRRILAYRRVAPSQHQRILGLLRFKLLITTNYDTIIEDVIYPRPEPFVAHNNYDLKYALDEVDSMTNHRPVLIKLNGCQTKPESIALGLGIKYYNDYWTRPLTRLYAWKKHLSLLFIGYSLNDVDFVNFMVLLRKNMNITAKNYAIVTETEYENLKNKPLVNDLNLRLIPYKQYSEDDTIQTFKGLWEILSQLRTDNTLDISPGLQSGVFFSKDQRSDYLIIQNELEQQSTCLRYLTPSPTNAISPAKYITDYCPEGLRRLHESFEAQLFGSTWKREEWVNNVIDKMLARRQSIQDMLKEGAEVRILCLERAVLKDAEKNNDLVNLKYRHIIQLIDNDDLDLEVRILERDKTDEGNITSFALMSAPNRLNTDLAMAYATQANKGGFTLHLIERNTNFVHKHLVSFEGVWARSLPTKDTRDYLCALFLKA